MAKVPKCGRLSRPALWSTPASEMTYIVSGGALNSTHSLTLVNFRAHYKIVGIFLGIFQLQASTEWNVVR